MINSESITFPILNNLEPNTTSCTMKLIEEFGELMQLLGKKRGASGEIADINRREWALKTVLEALDAAQSAITLADVLCKEYEFELDGLMESHKSKLKERGYLLCAMMTVGKEADNWTQGKGVQCPFVFDEVCEKSCESWERCNRLHKRNHDQQI